MFCALHAESTFGCVDETIIVNGTLTDICAAPGFDSTANVKQLSSKAQECFSTPNPATWVVTEECKAALEAYYEAFTGCASCGVTQFNIYADVAHCVQFTTPEDCRDSPPAPSRTAENDVAPPGEAPTMVADEDDGDGEHDDHDEGKDAQAVPPSTEERAVTGAASGVGACATGTAISILVLGAAMAL